MKESKFKSSVGFFIIGFHFSIILLIIGLHTIIGGFSFEQMTTTLALIIPMVGVYTPAIVKYFNNTKSMQHIKSKNVSRDYILLTRWVLGIYALALISIILLKSFNIAFSDFEQFKTMLGLIQTAFGVYVGMILSSMFEAETSKVEESKPKNVVRKIQERIQKFFR